MSRRSRRRQARWEAGAQSERAPEPPRERNGNGPLSTLGVQLVFLAAVFAAAVLLAELFGAANLGVAFGVGQIAFALAVVYLILRR